MPTALIVIGRRPAPLSSVSRVEEPDQLPLEREEIELPDGRRLILYVLVTE